MIALLQLHLAAIEADDLVKIAAAIVLFVLPALKGLLESRRKRTAQNDAKRDAMSTAETQTGTLETPEKEVAGRDLFEQLLRGEALEERSRPPPIPQAPASPRSYREGRVVLTETKALTETAPLTDSPALTDTPALTEARALTESPPLTGPTTERQSPYEQRKLATEALGEFAAPAKFGAGRRDLPAQASSSDPNAAMTSQTAGEVASTSGKRRRDRLQPGAPSRRELRRALILTEILAPPLALRQPGMSPSLPPGLR